MTVTVSPPQSQIVYVNPDGTLTLAGILLLQQIARAVTDHEARLVVLEP